MSLSPGGRPGSPPRPCLENLVFSEYRYCSSSSVLWVLTGTVVKESCSVIPFKGRNASLTDDAKTSFGTARLWCLTAEERSRRELDD